MDLKEKFAQKMLEEKLDFLPLEESLELFNAGIELETTFSYGAFTEEVEDGYDCELDFLFSELDEVYGIYDSEGKFKIDNYTLKFLTNEDESFERIICPAPTYIDLIK